MICSSYTAGSLTTTKNVQFSHRKFSKVIHPINSNKIELIFSAIFKAVSNINFKGYLYQYVRVWRQQFSLLLSKFTFSKTQWRAKNHFLVENTELNKQHQTFTNQTENFFNDLITKYSIYSNCIFCQGKGFCV